IDNQRERLLQAYLDKMSELLLEKHLRVSQPEEGMRKIARVRALTVLPRLNGKRKRNLLLFLYDADLIDRGHQIINLSDADLSDADLSGVSLCQSKRIRDNSHETEGVTRGSVSADLSGVNLRNANLNGANLAGVKFGANNRIYELELEISVEGIANLSGA